MPRCGALEKSQELAWVCREPAELVAAQPSEGPFIRMVVTFGAEGRVDFRPLIHALSSAIGGRVELRQVGDRDIAKLTGGIGRCGMTLCCVRWLGACPTFRGGIAKNGVAN